MRALAQWVLDFPDDSLDQGFPFDVPMLDLYLFWLPTFCLELARKIDKGQRRLRSRRTPPPLTLRKRRVRP